MTCTSVEVRGGSRQREEGWKSIGRSTLSSKPRDSNVRKTRKGTISTLNKDDEKQQLQHEEEEEEEEEKEEAVTKRKTIFYCRKVQTSSPVFLQMAQAYGSLEEKNNNTLIEEYRIAAEV